eukprot:6782490-Ditylum_brightwellii.AAC.1
MECFDFQEAGDRPAGKLPAHYTTHGISVKLLHVIAHCVGLNALCSDIGNAYVNAYTTEKVYAVAGPEFGETSIRKIVMIRKAL